MRFMLAMHSPGTGPYKIFSWSHEDINRHIQFMKDFNARIVAKGELIDLQALTGPEQAKLVKAGKDGKPVTDGVFAESKEFLAGYWIVEVDTRERAYELAAEISTAPGIGGVPLHMNVEVREVMVMPEHEVCADKLPRG